MAARSLSSMSMPGPAASSAASPEPALRAEPYPHATTFCDDRSDLIETKQRARSISRALVERRLNEEFYCRRRTDDGAPAQDQARRQWRCRRHVDRLAGRHLTRQIGQAACRDTG